MIECGSELSSHSLDHGTLHAKFVSPSCLVVLPLDELGADVLQPGRATFRICRNEHVGVFYSHHFRASASFTSSSEICETFIPNNFFSFFTVTFTWVETLCNL